MLLSVKGNRTPLVRLSHPYLMCVPLVFSLLNQFTHNLPLEAPLIYIPSLAFVGFTAIYVGLTNWWREMDSNHRNLLVKYK